MKGRLMASPTTPLPLIVHFELPQAGGLHAVGGIDIGGADHPAHGDGLVLGVDLDLLGGLHHQPAVGQHVGHARGQSGGQGGGAAGGSLAVQFAYLRKPRPGSPARRPPW